MAMIFKKRDKKKKTTNKKEIQNKKTYVNLSTKALRQSILKKLTFESVLVVHCEHALKYNTWYRELNANTNLSFETMPREKVVAVCKKYTIAEENLKSIVEGKLWKTSMFGSFY